MRLVQTNIQVHKESFNVHQVTENEADQQFVPRDSTDINAKMGHGMTAWQRISGNVPTSYVSYAEIQLMRFVSAQAVADTEVR